MWHLFLVPLKFSPKVELTSHIQGSNAFKLGKGQAIVMVQKKWWLTEQQLKSFSAQKSTSNFKEYVECIACLFGISFKNPHPISFTVLIFQEYCFNPS